MSIGDYVEQKILDAVFHGTTFTGIAATYLKLHIGDPGDQGLTNAAAEATRKAATWSAVVNGQVSLTSTLTWVSVAAQETYSYVSVWDATTGGNHLWNGPLLAPYDINAGDQFVLVAGTVLVTLV